MRDQGNRLPARGSEDGLNCLRNTPLSLRSRLATADRLLRVPQDVCHQLPVVRRLSEPADGTRIQLAQTRHHHNRATAGHDLGSGNCFRLGARVEDAHADKGRVLAKAFGVRTALLGERPVRCRYAVDRPHRRVTNKHQSRHSVLSLPIMAASTAAAGC